MIHDLTAHDCDIDELNGIDSSIYTTCALHRASILSCYKRIKCVLVMNGVFEVLIKRIWKIIYNRGLSDSSKIKWKRLFVLVANGPFSSS